MNFQRYQIVGITFVFVVLLLTSCLCVPDPEDIPSDAGEISNFIKGIFFIFSVICFLALTVFSVIFAVRILIYLSNTKYFIRGLSGVLLPFVVAIAFVLGMIDENKDLTFLRDHSSWIYFILGLLSGVGLISYFKSVFQTKKEGSLIIVLLALSVMNSLFFVAFALEANPLVPKFSLFFLIGVLADILIRGWDVNLSKVFEK